MKTEKPLKNWGKASCQFWNQWHEDLFLHLDSVITTYSTGHSGVIITEIPLCTEQYLGKRAQKGITDGRITWFITVTPVEYRIQ